MRVRALIQRLGLRASGDEIVGSESPSDDTSGAEREAVSSRGERIAWAPLWRCAAGEMTGELLRKLGDSGVAARAMSRLNRVSTLVPKLDAKSCARRSSNGSHSKHKKCARLRICS